MPDIARHLGLHRHGVQRIADELVAEGLARHDDNPRHRVSKLFVVTHRGNTAQSAIATSHAAWIRTLRSGTADVDRSKQRR